MMTIFDLGITWHLLYSNANRLLPNALWRRAGLYCRLPHGYVDLDTFYYEDSLIDDEKKVIAKLQNFQIIF